MWYILLVKSLFLVKVFLFIVLPCGESRWIYKGKGRYSFSRNSISELRDVTCHMGSHSVTCYPTQVNAPRLNPSQTGWCSIYLSRRDGRLSWPSWLDSAPAGSRPATFRSRVRRPTTVPPLHFTFIRIGLAIYVSLPDINTDWLINWLLRDLGLIVCSSGLISGYLIQFSLVSGATESIVQRRLNLSYRSTFQLGPIKNA